MNTFMAKPESVTRKWYVVDADGMVLGRLASQVAAILRGKNKPTFTPHVDTGDFVIVVNADKIVFTGKKLTQKIKHIHTGYIGHMKEIPYEKLMETKSDYVVEQAIKGMLPKNSLGRDMIKKLKVFKGAEHNHSAQMPVALELVKR